MVSSTEKESIAGWMDHATKANFMKEWGTAKDLGAQRPTTSIFTSEPTKMTRKTDTGDMYGQMAAPTKVDSAKTLSIVICYFRHGKGRLTYQDGK